MSESTAVEAPAAKEPFFKMSSIPGANILVPLLLGCLLNTLFPHMTQSAVKSHNGPADRLQSVGGACR